MFYYKGFPSWKKDTKSILLQKHLIFLINLHIIRNLQKSILFISCARDWNMLFFFKWIHAEHAGRKILYEKDPNRG